MDYNLDHEIPKQSHFGLYAMIGVLVTSVSLTAYMYMTKDFVPKGELEFKYIKKDEINFDSLPIDMQNKYVLKIELEKKDTNNTVEKIVYKDKIIYQDKIVYQDKIIYKNKKIDKTKFDRYSCTKMVSGGILPSKECEKRLYEFLDKNKDSSLIEIINMNDNKEISFFKQLKADKNYNKTTVNRISNYTQIGLSQKRIVEASWIINKYLDNNITVETANYSLDSTNGRSGFIVKAYK